MKDRATDPSDRDAAARAAARARWPVRIVPLGAETSDLSEVTTAEERVAMVWELTLRAWELGGTPIPDYRRKETPIALRRLRTE